MASSGTVSTARRDSISRRRTRLSPERHQTSLRWNGAGHQLVERNRVSKPLEGYTQNTQNVAALKRAREQDFAVHPGQDIEFVVIDDEKASRERVALAHKEIDSYDASYYETQLVRAVESVLSPMGSVEDPSRSWGDTSAGVDGVREH